MSGGAVYPARSQSPFTLAHARDEHWGLAAKACLDGIAAAAPTANLGMLYATEAFAADLPSILTFLRETTHIRTWVGATVPGLMCGEHEIREGGGLAVMVGHLPEHAFRCFAGLHPADLAELDGTLAVVHGDARNPALDPLIRAAAERMDFLVGGLVSASGVPAQIADNPVSSGLSGLVLSDQIQVMTGLTQGCSPMGGRHVVTKSWEGVIMELDGRPALEVMKEEAGELIARDLKKAAGYIHVGLPVPLSDTNDYMVRSLVGIDPRQGWLAIADRIAEGDTMVFVRRDANTARADLSRMLDGLTARLGGKPVLAAHYVSCVARGRHMFGEDGIETAMIREALGDVPLIGFFGNGEISRDRLYSYAGVLTLLIGPC